MSPAHVLEPTYEAIRQRLKAGIWPAGGRLEAVKIADDLGVSMTPVRDSLYRLAGERMVVFAHGEGFHVPRLTETEFRDMLELNLVLLLSALAIGGSGPHLPPATETEDPCRTAALFDAIAHRSGNAELATAIAALNDRLHPTRRLDAIILEDSAAEITAIEAAFDDENRGGTTRQLVIRYHERRAREAAAYAQLLANQGA